LLCCQLSSDILLGEALEVILVRRKTRPVSLIDATTPAFDGAVAERLAGKFAQRNDPIWQRWRAKPFFCRPGSDDELIGMNVISLMLIGPSC
jgi:hypothetical protein